MQDLIDKLLALPALIRGKAALLLLRSLPSCVFHQTLTNAVLQRPDEYAQDAALAAVASGIAAERARLLTRGNSRDAALGISQGVPQLACIVQHVTALLGGGTHALEQSLARAAREAERRAEIASKRAAAQAANEAAAAEAVSRQQAQQRADIEAARRMPVVRAGPGGLSMTALTRHNSLRNRL